MTFPSLKSFASNKCAQSMPKNLERMLNVGINNTFYKQIISPIIMQIISQIDIECKKDLNYFYSIVENNDVLAHHIIVNYPSRIARISNQVLVIAVEKKSKVFLKYFEILAEKWKSDGCEESASYNLLEIASKGSLNELNWLISYGAEYTNREGSSLQKFDNTEGEEYLDSFLG